MCTYIYIATYKLMYYIYNVNPGLINHSLLGGYSSNSHQVEELVVQSARSHSSESSSLAESWRSLRIRGHTIVFW